MNIRFFKFAREAMLKADYTGRGSSPRLGAVAVYKGAIIGVIIAIVLLATRLYDVIIGILLILAGAIIGNYVQQNKDDVKAKLKKFIDKM